MSRKSGVLMLWAVLAFTVLAGCSVEEGSPALTISAPENATTLAKPAEVSTTVALERGRAESLAEPDDPFTPIRDTADAALRAVLEGLHEHHPEVVWDALPASYQQDLNELVHLFAARMHPEAWKWFLQIASKGARVLRLPREEPEQPGIVEAAVADDATADETDAIQQASIRDRLAISKNENIRLPGLLARKQDGTARAPETIEDQHRREDVAVVLDEIADSGPAGLDVLKTASVGRLLRGKGAQTLLEAWHCAIGSDMATDDLQDIFAMVDDPSKVRLALKESAEDAAIVEIVFPNGVPGDIECVRIDGKWIPRLIADAWIQTVSGLKRSVLEALPSEIATENFGTLFQYLGMIDLCFDGELAQGSRLGDGDDMPDAADHSVLLEAPLMLLEYLIAGPPSELDEMTDADGILVNPSMGSEISSQEGDSREAASPFETLVGKSLIDGGKRVAVLCGSSLAVQSEHPTFAAGVVEEITRRFKAGKINVVDPGQVVLPTEVQDGDDSDLTLPGTQLEADYIVHFHIETLGFTEENFPELRRGRARGQVVVVEMANDDNGQKDQRIIFKQPFESKYPNNPAVAADPEEPDAFKQRYLARLHYELARLFLREP
jgi:hypothetical protein